METKRFTWQVEGTDTVGVEGKTYTRNYLYMVYAPTLQEAVNAVIAKRPNFVFIKVLRDRWIEEAIIV